MDIAQTMSSLRLHNILIDKVEWIRSEDTYELPDNLKFNFNSEIFESEDKTSYRVSLSIKIDGEEKKYIHIIVKMSGYFSFNNNEEGIDSNLKDTIIKKNTLAILFPYLRSFVTNLTAQTGMTPIILPTLNINALVDKECLEVDNKDANGD